MLDSSPALAHGPRPLALKLKAPTPVLVRSAAFILAVLLVLGAFPAMRRADDAVAAQRSRWRVLYECARATLAIAAAAAICLWILIGV